MKKKQKKVVVVKEPLTLFQGIRVSHPKYGKGTVVRIEKKSSFDTSAYGSRHHGQANVGIVFDDGGPQGWNEDSSYKLSELKERGV